MDAWLDRLRPVPRPAGAHAAQAVHTYLRDLVLDGTIPPGAEVNQVDIAQRLGISRTPVREAIRMLQEEGLVDAEPWKRARVVGFDAAHLESVYVQRILLEGLGVTLTVPRMTAADRAALSDMARELAGAGEDAGKTEAWEALHHRFHLALVAGASDELRRVMEGNMTRAQHYRTQYSYRGPLPSLRQVGEHDRIAALSCDGDAAGAAGELAAHLARTALSLIGQLAPRYDPAAIRLSLDPFQAGMAPQAPTGSGRRRATRRRGAPTA
jgi:DNA-binding GntR family transcriptional regulator